MTPRTSWPKRNARPKSSTQTRADHEAFAAAQQELERLGDVGSERDALRERLSLLQEAETRADLARNQARQSLQEAQAAADGLGELAAAAEAETTATKAVQALRSRLAAAAAIAERADRAQVEAMDARRELAGGLRRSSQ